jgi:hypothetical protein
MMDGSTIVNEVNTESISLARLDLKGTSRLVVLLGSKEGIRGISRRISLSGDFVRVGKGLFIANSVQAISVDAFQSLPMLSFIRTREIPRRKDWLEDPYANRTYSIVSYSFSNPTAGQKKRVERLIRRSAGIRLRPGVLLFPVLRAKERRRVIENQRGHPLFDSKEFNMQLKSMGATSVRWSRLRLASSSDSGYIRDAIERTMSRDLLSIETRLQEIRELCKNRQISTESLRKRSSAALRRYRKLKLKWTLAKDLWHIDAERQLKRIYNLGRNTKFLIDSRG